MAQPALTDDLCQQAVDAVAAHGSKSAASRALGIPASTFVSRWDAACKRGFKPQAQALIGAHSAAPPEGYKLKGTSTLYGEDGVAKLQWVKTDASLAQLYEMQKAALAAMCAELKPLGKIAAPKTTEADLATLYTLTDCHIGMLAWDKETGADWDLPLAERCLAGTFIRMIDAAPPSAVGIVNQLGDFLHFDSLTPETPAHRHILDADSRYQKVVEVAVRILRRVIEHALTKHKHVHVELKEGNHDPAGSVWLRVLFAQLYEKNPRVHISMSPNPYTVYEHGNTLLGFYHGHLAKPPSLPQIFAQQFRKEWGNSTHTYIHIGHKHHIDEKEYPGVNVIQHATIAAPDAYAARGGWISKRQATSMTYHKTRGEVARAIYIPEIGES